MSHAQYPADLASIASARAFVSEAMGQLAEDLRERAVLMTSELASNAIRHAHSPFTVTTTMDSAEFRVSVTDAGGAVPLPQHSSPTDTSGRGLLIVDALADRWGTEIERGSTTVWFSLTLTPPST